MNWLKSLECIFFSRWFGDKFTPYYIGQSVTVRARLKQHLQNNTMCDILQGRTVTIPGNPPRQFDPGKGHRYFHYGYFLANGHAHPSPYIEIVEKQMIHQAVQHTELLNQKETIIKTHTIVFDGYEGAFCGFAKRCEVEA
jgi:hypothetical protein